MITNVRKHHTTCIFKTSFLSKMLRKIQHLLRNNTTNPLLCNVYGHFISENELIRLETMRLMLATFHLFMLYFPFQEPFSITALKNLQKIQQALSNKPSVSYQVRVNVLFLTAMLTNKLFCKCSVNGLPSGKILPTFKPNMFRQDVQMKLDAEAITLIKLLSTYKQ